jgi:hypothetical protein
LKIRLLTGGVKLNKPFEISVGTQDLTFQGTQVPFGHLGVHSNK